VPDLPLTLDAVRDWLGDFEIAKGQPYARSATGCVRDADTIRASVKGTRPRPYRVWVRVAASHVEAAHCTCPVGAEGTCKHVAGVLLAYLEHPRRFAVVENLNANLASRSQAELVALVKALLHRAPELEPLVARPRPGFATAPPGSTDYYYLALDAIRATNPHDDWAPHEIAAGLREVIDYARAFGKESEQEACAAVASALRDELGPAKATEVATELVAAVREQLQTEEPPAGAAEPPF
jgi:uncharacterized Zn finger protein